jgi:hypothetical protein
MVTPETMSAIEKGLEYLARTQRADGSWLNSGSYGSYPGVMTSLAGMALMANGSTPETGKYAKNVRKAMMYIIASGEATTDGMLAGAGSEGRSMYGHGFAMLFLSQCYGMDMDKETGDRIRKVLDRAVLLTAQSQSDLGPQLKHAGGWIYTPDQHSDEGSVTVTQLQALRGCRNVGIKVPKSTIERAVAYLKACQQPDGGICYSYASQGSSTPAISAAGIACFYAAGVYDRQSGGGGDEAKMVDKLVQYCLRNNDMNHNNGHFFYTHMYMAEGLYQRGGKDWVAYYPKIRDHLIKEQSLDGSWMGDGVGTTYGTAIGLIILQQPFGYLPITQR